MKPEQQPPSTSEDNPLFALLKRIDDRMSHLEKVQETIIQNRTTTTEPTAPRRRGRPPKIAPATATTVEATARKLTPEELAAQKQAELRARVQEALMEEPLTAAKLAAGLHQSQHTVDTLLQELKSEGKIFNMAMGDLTPMWYWRVGDNTDFPTLILSVKNLIRHSPLARPDLEQITGARLSRVDGAIVELRRTYDVINLGTERRARWFLRSETPPQEGGLAPKKTPGGKVIHHGNWRAGKRPKKKP